MRATATMSYTADMVWLALQGISLEDVFPSKAGADMPILSIFDADGVMTQQLALDSDRCIECGDAIALNKPLSVTTEGDEPVYYGLCQVVLIPKVDWCLTRLEHVDCVVNNPGDTEDRRMEMLERATAVKERQRAEREQIEAANRAMWKTATVVNERKVAERAKRDAARKANDRSLAAQLAISNRNGPLPW